jgi:hypothetical protein
LALMDPWRTAFGIVGRMEVTFSRTGERRYAIAADRGKGPVMHMPAGPGYHAWLPHDLVHFVVERHFGIAGSVFGQLAAGGNAGTFFTIPDRRRDRDAGRSERLGALGRQASSGRSCVDSLMAISSFADTGRGTSPVGRPRCRSRQKARSARGGAAATDEYQPLRGMVLAGGHELRRPRPAALS